MTQSAAGEHLGLNERQLRPLVRRHGADGDRGLVTEAGPAASWGDRIVDACVDGRRTIITRRHRELTGDSLFLFVKGGEVTFDAIEARPLDE